MPTWVYRFLRWCPGILGLLLRQRLYPCLLGHCGRGVLIGRHVDLINPGGISLGDKVIVNDGARLDAGSHSGPDTAIDVADGAFIGADTLLAAGPGRLIVGEGSNIGSRCTIVAAGDVVLGHHSLLAGYCMIGDIPEAPAATAGHDPQIPTGPTDKPTIIIGPGCWLGLRSQVTAGVRIGQGVIVGAHALVTEPLPEFAIAVGRPATIKRMRP
ncbi:acyltransferase [Desulfoprunum benzoelyticum]|uniref:Acetyltransferase-like isoleucine patch superfamily enzyme n=1 Tax=Desulfoprunum benzoelyticum TaxID=1506996 RepID=A0A840V3I1_9BACT|nr:acyltransferase [Desulfoprunum benzoelyticum]MBB5349378.1 acetyltransferase-like isoleucine patch superfamily enzyme [Desulfoprunum benzoelyticum]MBM9531048.1 acyltransferase [Desulfoprunum benzoelyticum]